MQGGPGERDEVWFAGLYRRHQADVLRYARRRVLPHEVDDVVAEVFTTAWRRRAEVPGLDRLWLLTTAHHLVLHTRRAGARRQRLTDSLVPPPPVDGAPEDVLDVLAALRRLHPTDREVLTLVAWDDLTAAEVAVVLGCSAVAARARLSRARRRLAALLVDRPVTAQELT